MSAAADVRRILTLESTMGLLVVRTAELKERLEALEKRLERLENSPFITRKSNAAA
jgi:polyhydroxyalkanoate synthesis regulator phasin